MKLDNGKVAVLVEDLYEDLELWYPVYRLREEGAEVSLVGPEAGKTYSSKHGYPAIADLAAKDVTADQFQAVIIQGGYAPDRMRRDQAMVDLVTDAVDNNKTWRWQEMRCLTVRRCRFHSRHCRISPTAFRQAPACGIRSVSCLPPDGRPR